jgi:hypothetical protein
MRSQKLSAMNRVDVSTLRRAGGDVKKMLLRIRISSASNKRAELKISPAENRGDRRKMRLPRLQGQRDNEVKTASKLSTIVSR